MGPSVRLLVAGLLGVSLAGCRFDFDHVPPDGGDGTEDRDAPPGPGADGGSDGGSPLGPFGPPEQVIELSTRYGEDDPTLTADLLEIYYNTQRSGSVDIWHATRGSRLEPFGAPSLVAELSNPWGTDSTPEISPDGLTIFISRTQFDATTDLLVSTRPSRREAWSSPVPVDELNSPWSEAGAAITADLTSLFFFSDRAGTFDLYLTRRSAGTPWAAPGLLAELSQGSYDADPCPALDGELLVFASDRQGGFDLFTSRTGSTGGAFGPAVPLRELNSPAEERDPWISLDGRVIYFESGIGGAFHIYTARR